MNATVARTGFTMAATALLLTGCTDIERALNQGATPRAANTSPRMPTPSG